MKKATLKYDTYTGYVMFRKGSEVEIVKELNTNGVKQFIIYDNKINESTVVADFNLIIEPEWASHEDRLALKSFITGDFTIESNSTNWKETKKREKQAKFFIQVTDNHAGLSTDSAKKLRDYLTEKIKYLEGE